MCGEYKDVSQYRFMKHLNRYCAYCKDCERWYNKHYVRKKNEKCVS